MFNGQNQHVSHRFLTKHYLSRRPGKNLCVWCQKPVSVTNFSNWGWVEYRPGGVQNRFLIGYGHNVCPDEDDDEPLEEINA